MIDKGLKKHNIAASKLIFRQRKTEEQSLRSATFIKESDYKEYAKLTGEPFNTVANKEVVFCQLIYQGRR